MEDLFKEVINQPETIYVHVRLYTIHNNKKKNMHIFKGRVKKMKRRAKEWRPFGLELSDILILESLKPFSYFLIQYPLIECTYSLHYSYILVFMHHGRAYVQHANGVVIYFHTNSQVFSPPLLRTLSTTR